MNGLLRGGLKTAFWVVAAALLAVPATAQETGYGETPAELVPYRDLGPAYWRFFTEPPTFRGPGRELPDPEGLEDVAIGLLTPLSGPDEALGRRFLAGAKLAVEQANATGGYHGKLPFRLVVRDENQAWGAAAGTAVSLLDEEGVWGIVGAFNDIHSHVMNRVLLKIEVPVINTSGTDPTLTEHAIPWMLRMRPDDRQASYELAKRIFQELGLERVVVFRSNDRYGRVGTAEFVDAARRLHRPILLEVRFTATQTAWPAEIERIQALEPQAVVVWGRAEPTARVVRALRDAGLRAPLFGPDRLADPAFLSAAGAAAEGLVLAFPFEAEAENEAWSAFRAAYRDATGEEPDPVAAYAYDGMRVMLQSIEGSGLNRPRIRDWMFDHPAPPEPLAPLRFDTTLNNVASIRLARVVDGQLVLEPR